MAHITITTGTQSLTSASHSVKTSAQSLSQSVAEYSASRLKDSDTNLSSSSSFTLIRSAGDPYELYHSNPDVMAQAKALAERLDGSIHDSNQNHFFYQGRMSDLMRAGVLTDPEFLDMASGLSDQGLEDLADTLQAMVLPASSSITHHAEANRTLTEKVTQFKDVLKNSSVAQQEQILSQGASYAAQVNQEHLSTFSAVVYGQDIGRFNALQRFSDDSSANNLQNFVTAVIASDAPAALTEQLGELSPEAQQGLLNVYGLDTELGERLFNLMAAEQGAIPESLIKALGDMVAAIKISPFAEESFGFAYTGEDALAQDNEQSSGRDFALDSVTSMISLLESHDLPEEQLTTLGSELNRLSNPEKRAYIDITTSGIDTLLAQGKNLEEALETVSALRTQPDVLELVNRTRYHDVTLVERPDIEEGLTVVALEGAAVFQNANSAFSQSRLLLGATPDKVQMEKGHSVKGHESENLYSAKDLETYKSDVSHLINTLVSFESMSQDSTASEKTSLTQFARELNQMHSGIRDDLMENVSNEIRSESFRNKVTTNTQFAFLSNALQEMKFDLLQRNSGFN